MNTPADDPFDQAIRRGIDARRAGDLEAALQAFQGAVSLRPASPGARSELAYTQLQAGQLDAAERSYQEVLAGAPAHIEALAGIGQVARRRGDLATARAAFERAVAAAPDRPALACELAEVMRAAGDTEAALARFRSVRVQHPTHWPALVGIGLMGRARGDHAAAVEAFRAARKVAPGHVGIRHELAFSERQAGDPDAAAELYRETLTTDPDNADALAGLAGAERARGEPAAALIALRAARARRPGDFRLGLELARELGAQRLVDEAAGLYATLAERHPQEWTIAVGAALLERGRADHESSLRHLLRARTLEPGHAGIAAETALTLRTLGRLDEAEAIYRAAAATDPAAAAPHTGLALVALARGAREAALGHARDALAREPASTATRLQVASLLRDTGELGEAATLVDAVLADEPMHAGAAIEEGLILRQRGQRAAALAAFARARSAQRERADFECAHELVALGRPAEARALHEALLASDPASIVARVGLAELALMAGDAAGCIASADAVLDMSPGHATALRLKCRALIQLDRADEALALARSAAAGMGGAREALLLEMLRTVGLPAEAGALVAEPAVRSTRDFTLWVEAVFTCLAFFDVDTARVFLDASPAARPYERSREAYARATVADLEWRIDDAIAGFEAALTLNPNDAGAHDQLARLTFLAGDGDGCLAHLRAWVGQLAALRQLRGESLNPSQSLQGALLNEQRLEPAAAAVLREAGRELPSARIPALNALVRDYPNYTPAALSLLLALRQCGAFTATTPSAPRGAFRIPRSILQYWNDVRAPAPIRTLMHGWVDRHGGFSYHRFDEPTAAAYLDAHYPREVLKAFRGATHPAQASDVFRLAYLAREGGYYIDADDRCVGHLATITDPAAEFIVYQEQYATLGNNFIACMPGDAVIARALALAVEAVNRGDHDGPWLATGPGLMTRAFAAELVQAPDATAWLATRRILERAELVRALWPHAIASYKNTPRSWARSLFARRG